MNLQEMQDLIGQMLQVQRQMQESHLEASIRLAQTEAIANSNARAIEALTNESSEERQVMKQNQVQIQAQLLELTRIVSQFAEATNTRLSNLENN
jgi:hypothetical protein